MKEEKRQNLRDEEIEIALLLEAVYRKHGYDFRQYANASLSRRIRKCVAEAGLESIAELIPKILHDKKYLSTFLQSLTVNVTEMFRDPDFFLALRQRVIPYLNTFHHIKIWSVGVATGEEVYSLAILLKEEGLYDKTLIYATDLNDMVLETARRGIYSADEIKRSTVNYQKAGGTGSFGSYYRADYESAILSSGLKKNIVFANHNLVTDSDFAEVHLVLCRNVMIYFNKELQERVFALLSKSLCHSGFLCLGTKEDIHLSRVAPFFSTVDQEQKIFQKRQVEGEG